MDGRMPLVVNVHEARMHLSRLLERVMAGEEIVIAKAGKPVALLSPYYPEQLAERVPGNDAGKVIIAPDFDAPLPEFEEL
jgi:prevent-host-death family protein